MKKINLILQLVVVMASVAFAQQATTINVNILNNTYKHVDLTNAYGTSPAKYASTDIVGDKFTMTANLANDIYRLDFGSGNAVFVVLTPGENMNLTIDANNPQEIVSVSGSETMEKVKQMIHYPTLQKKLLDSINLALQNDPQKIYWTDFTQNFNQYRQTNDDVDEYVEKSYENLDSIVCVFDKYMHDGKVSGKNTKTCGDEINKWLKKLEINYAPFNSYLENVNKYYNFSGERLKGNDKFYADFDQYQSNLSERHKIASANIKPVVDNAKSLLAVRDSLAFNDLLNSKNITNWLKNAYTILYEGTKTAAKTKSDYLKNVKSDAVKGKAIFTDCQNNVQKVLSRYQSDFDEQNDYLNERLINDIKENKDNLCVLMFIDRYPAEKYAALHNEVFTALHAKHPDHPIVKERWNYMNSPAAKVSIGAIAPELEFPNPEGKLLKLSDLRGKVVLIDFWASWCGPCRRENPNVTRIYEKYHDKGFEIFSVSLDSDASAWKRAIEADKLVWPNHVSDLKKWQSKAAAIYGVTSIPSTFLLTKDGRIVQKNLRGADLERAVQQLLEK